jgi:vancomycin resistance protein YoaR
MGSPPDTHDRGRADHHAHADRTEHAGTSRRRPAWLVPALVVVGVVMAVLVALTIWVNVTDTDVVLDGVAVDGEPVGGLDRAGLERAVGVLSTDRELLPVTVAVAVDDDAPGTSQVDADRVTAGVVVEAGAAVDRAWSYGRRGPVQGTIDRFRARGDASFPVPLEERVDEHRLDAFASDTAATLSLPAQDGGVALLADGDDAPAVELTDAVDGRDVDPETVRAALRDDLDAAAPIDAEVAFDTVRPAIEQADVDAIVEAAEAVVSGPVTLENPTSADDLEVDEVELATLVQVASDPAATEGERLQLVLPSERVRGLLGDDRIEALQIEPVDASSEVVGAELEVTGGSDGFVADEEGIAEAILSLATAADPDDRSGELPGETAAPDVGVDDLDIREEVASFSTTLIPGEPRNVNIQRGAELLAGTVLAPGEQLSLDDTLGPRTPERGFQENGFIRRGEVVSVVGGGTSQLATTTMNAAWFAGLRLVTFQPHSIYFTRYPMGREATISRNTIDLVIENDSPYELAFGAAATEEEVTVLVFSRPWAEVDTWTGEPYDETEGELRDGFTIDFGRTVTTPDGERSEDYTHVYLPEDEPGDAEEPAEG